MIRIMMAFGLAICLTACDTAAYKPGLNVGGPPLVSGTSPPSPYAHNSMPETANSLPAGAEGKGAIGAFRPPNYASITFAVPRL